jgi:hypothetical protein
VNLPPVGLDQVELGALVLVPTRFIESFEQMLLLGPAFIVGDGVMFTFNVPVTLLQPAFKAVRVNVTEVGAAAISEAAGL